MGGEAFHGEEEEVGNAVLVGEVAGAMHGVSAEVAGRGGLDYVAVAVDELEVEVEVGAVARGPFANPEGVVNGVVGASAKFVEARVDLPDQGLVVEVDAPNYARMRVAAIEVLAVVGHVAHVVVGIVDARNVEFV